ncbi:hypothetical protein PPERSA_11397 [Pseudocohnilembus persalinus]|uniref:Radial spokehead-like protein n=1 Tax=Pseudocohnilembus persalinus TaxID=266149 RepID=A0A0V0QQ20_PSEPJ|nr:hypothetical protein PPERSA_11397 [Pseudocohnilembus persalinus]|eukprot:KRX04273.1 hypothetical protein PPERSA_11397 [Pseudocohnilembus persalinus]
MDKITQLLQENKSKDGISLLQHFQEIFQEMIKSGEDKKVQNFEVLSNFIKKNKFVYKNPLSDSEVNNIPVQHNEIYEWTQKCLKLFREYQQLKKQKEQKILFPDFVADSQILEWAGVNFGEEEAVRIQMSLRKLQNQTKAQALRLWGKILTRGNDYYIAEGLVSNENSDQVPSDSEPIGQGANQYTYWVTHDVLEEWFVLPFVTPQQIKAAQQVKYMLSGNLDSPVNSYPSFPGKEKHFLRAQIARISAATVVAPRDLYTYDDETKTLQFGESPYKLPEYAELKTLDQWVHLYPALLKQGRTTYWVDPTLSQEQQDEILGELETNDPVVDRLRSIGDAEEKSPYPKQNEEDDDEPNWVIKEYGDNQQYNLIGKDSGNIGCYGTIQIKNLTWPGAQIVCNSKTWVNIYVGYGFKQNQVPFQPVQPPMILQEGDDLEEHREPNPDKPIDELEPDSDKEGNEEGEEDEQ